MSEKTSLRELIIEGEILPKKLAVMDVTVSSILLYYRS